jgi:hypothetical protein
MFVQNSGGRRAILASLPKILFQEAKLPKYEKRGSVDRKNHLGHRPWYANFGLWGRWSQCQKGTSLATIGGLTTQTV